VYEGVLVELGPRMAAPDGVTFFPVLRGIELGDRVVAAGSFLVDAETRLNSGGGVDLLRRQQRIERVRLDGHHRAAVHAARPRRQDQRRAGQLSPSDRALATAQRYCPMLENSRLGSMGAPVKVLIQASRSSCAAPAAREGPGRPSEDAGQGAELKEANQGTK